MAHREIGPAILQGPYRPRHRRLGLYFRPGVLVTSAFLSAVGLTAVLAHVL